MGTIGGAASVACYTALALAGPPLAFAVGSLRRLPGVGAARHAIVAGLAILWIFLFFRPLAPFGALLVSLWGTGAVDLVSALSVVNIVMIAAGLAVALRLGVRLHA